MILPAKPPSGSLYGKGVFQPRLMTPEGKSSLSHDIPMIFPPYLPVLSCCCWLSHQKLVWWWNMLLSICEGPKGRSQSHPNLQGPLALNLIRSSQKRFSHIKLLVLLGICGWITAQFSHPWDIPHGHLTRVINLVLSGMTLQISGLIPMFSYIFDLGAVDNWEYPSTSG